MGSAEIVSAIFLRRTSFGREDEHHVLAVLFLVNPKKVCDKEGRKRAQEEAILYPLSPS